MLLPAVDVAGFRVVVATVAVALAVRVTLAVRVAVAEAVEVTARGTTAVLVDLRWVKDAVEVAMSAAVVLTRVVTATAVSLPSGTVAGSQAPEGGLNLTRERERETVDVSAKPTSPRNPPTSAPYSYPAYGTDTQQSTRSPSWRRGSRFLCMRRRLQRALARPSIRLHPAEESMYQNQHRIR